jgi:hypothetical protein
MPISLVRGDLAKTGCHDEDRGHIERRRLHRCDAARDAAQRERS